MERVETSKALRAAESSSRRSGVLMIALSISTVLADLAPEMAVGVGSNPVGLQDRFVHRVAETVQLEELRRHRGDPIADLDEAGVVAHELRLGEVRPRLERVNARVITAFSKSQFQ